MSDDAANLSARAVTSEDGKRAVKATAGMENYLGLPPRIQRFVRIIVETQGFHGAGAAAVREVKPQCGNPKQQAWRWLRMPRIKAAITELTAKPRAAFEQRYARHLVGNYNRANADRSLIVAAALLGPEAVGLPKDPRQWPQELKDCIEGVKIKDGLPEITLSDRNTASRLFSQHMGWMTERHELSGPNGGPLQSIAITTEDPVEAARAYQELIKGQ